MPGAGPAAKSIHYDTMTPRLHNYATSHAGLSPQPTVEESEWPENTSVTHSHIGDRGFYIAFISACRYARYNSLPEAITRNCRPSLPEQSATQTPVRHGRHSTILLR